MWVEWTCEKIANIIWNILFKFLLHKKYIFIVGKKSLENIYIQKRKKFK